MYYSEIIQLQRTAGVRPSVREIRRWDNENKLQLYVAYLRAQSGQTSSGQISPGRNSKD